MWKKIIIFPILLLIYSLICIIIYNNYKDQNTSKKIITILSEKNTTPLKLIEEKKSEKPIGKLIINKINLQQYLYDINSSKNNIEEHVTILKYSEEPSIKNSTIFLAAHSGTGAIAYFEELDQLTTNDKIILEYKNQTYTYQVKDIWEYKKTGTITVPKENTNQLVLTTCHPNKDGYQLIINCILM